ncbi:hypothetical protein [Roseibacillus ishigakijimensis]|uniref:Uncharacterized protein n=1 Tax=Roseibacillus ishigakijimensis TaxID=454146 RepID=A0A934RU50_9BACT|nr:hypothetical protein [Roseibacillus ishigakijimensis]MBK1835074.1 hypothetical protein [Roseibacillus ishigakijimensis]
MKIPLPASTALLAASLGLAALAPAQEGRDEAPAETVAERVLAQAEELAYEQDELSADVMELVESQTDLKVIALLEEVEFIMAEVTDGLVEGETGGGTMAAQTEIIEKILAAAQQKQQSSGESSPESQESMGAMLDMMKRMMGKEPGDQNGPPQNGEQPGQTGGEGQTGESDRANERVEGEVEGATSERVIPKGSAPSGNGLPREFQKLLDAYNRNDSQP